MNMSLFLGVVAIILGSIFIGMEIGFTFARKKMFYDGVVCATKEDGQEQPRLVVKFISPQENMYLEDRFVLKWSDDEETNAVRYRNTWMADD